MAEIKVLSEDTIDKIAAGEVVERPMSVVKELVENAMDAGSTVITVEIKNGGIDLIRVTDNGDGIAAEEVRMAFARHATSKIRSVEDLGALSSMGFRGEALSSIAAVAQVELVSKTRAAITGVRYVIEGAVEKELEEIGAPDGTTFLVKNLFFNTPVRRKFLKQPPTEAGYVAELLERLAMARPDISFKFIQNGQVKFHTPGNGDLKEVIYRIYGREISNHLFPIEIQEGQLVVKGFLGKPEINRSNRNFEHYFINSRYVKSKVIAKAIEDGYKQYVMQHKFPFVVLHFSMSPEVVDVNVHPTKMEVRFSDEGFIYRTISQAIIKSFRSKELIAEVGFGKEAAADKREKKPIYDKKAAAEAILPLPIAKPVRPLTPFVLDFTEAPETMTANLTLKEEAADNDREEEQPQQTAGTQSDRTPAEAVAKEATDEEREKEKPRQSDRMQTEAAAKGVTDEEREKEKPRQLDRMQTETAEKDVSDTGRVGAELVEAPAKTLVLEHVRIADAVQETLFEERFLTEKAKESYEILGQIFGTYWIVSYSDRMYMIDQHAAHEKVKYERLVRAMEEKNVLVQHIMPPVILQTSGKEEQVVLEHMDSFSAMGFELEEFGDHTFCLRAVPVDLYGCSYEELFREMLDEMTEGMTGTPEVVLNKMASMACKAAVKGNTRLSRQEAEKLIEELLTLENPYHCPHGRPTIISMTKQEIEKKFKRIV